MREDLTLLLSRGRLLGFFDFPYELFMNYLNNGQLRQVILKFEYENIKKEFSRCLANLYRQMRREEELFFIISVVEIWQRMVFVKSFTRILRFIPVFIGTRFRNM